MGRQSESQRRKGICISCNEYKPIKAKCKCQNCWHKYKSKYDIRFFIRQKYTQIKQRCENQNREDFIKYKGKLQMTMEDFYQFSIENKNLIFLWTNFQKPGALYSSAPSVDRIDNNKSYSIDNIQWISHGINAQKDQKVRPVSVYLVNGDKLGDFKSLNDAVRYCDVQQSNAWKVLNGTRRHTEGYVFKDCEVVNA